MPRTALRRIIAKRTYDLAAESGTGSRPVTLAISEPQREPGSGSYRCFYRIAGLQYPVLRYAAGADAVQALLLATVNAASLLYTSDEWKQGRLTQHGSRNLDLPAISRVFGEAVPDKTLELVV
ncbi:hypothetical protein [Rhizobacter sp. AJA081-3]|uniref:DUF6968 family protein n=1 Tax=Rhizobacter sp. AJA081-3 TaxID=2753607 RepID=UPI0035304917